MDTVNYNNDCLFEVLMRVDPADIVNCILVSKDWLEVIAGQDFRTKYLNKWKGKFVVGLLMSYVDELIMLPITGLGRQLNDKTLIPERIGSFVSRSPNSSHVLFIHFSEKPWLTNNHYEKTLYVWTGGPTIGSPLPPPPAYYHHFAANILFDVDANSFKVIISECLEGKRMNTVNIQTFSSSTRQWEQSVLTCSISFTLELCFVNGAVKTRGGGVVIYWGAWSRGLKCLAVWDINGGSNSVSLILEPEFPSLLRIPFYEGGEIRREQFPEPRLHFIYGTSPNGSLLSAICTPSNYYEYPSDHYFDSELWMIKIFTFDENTKDWSLLHQVRYGSIWTNNLALLSSLFGDEAKLSSGFFLLSFLPGRFSILVELEQHIFEYHLESQKLEHLDYSKYNNPYPFRNHVALAYHPLTLQDVGVWLSSPPSISLEGGNRNTPCRKHPPSSTVGSLAFCLKYTSLLFMFLIMYVIFPLLSS